MTNFIKSALIIGSLVISAVSFADTKAPATGSGAGMGSAKGNDVKKPDTTKKPADTTKKPTTAPKKDTTPPATK